MVEAYWFIRYTKKYSTNFIKKQLKQKGNDRYIDYIRLSAITDSIIVRLDLNDA